MQSVVDTLIAPMPTKVKQVAADTVYDSNCVYKSFENHFSHIYIVIPNQAEPSIGRYKRILGNRLHSCELTRQRQEGIIGCSILNKMTCFSLAVIRSKF